MFLEVKPNANSKNFLHKLKELYGVGKNAKIKVSYNFINLINIEEEELKDLVNEVVDNAKNFN